jgi:hypothetical protein
MEAKGSELTPLTSLFGSEWRSNASQPHQSAKRVAQPAVAAGSFPI